jgi:co-chaperonin GroES (HSP10)
MSFPIQPEGDKIIVAPIPKKDVKIGKIIVPKTANADVSYGYVMAIGNEISHKHKDESVVIYATQAGVGQMIDGRECIWISLQNVWGWFDKDKWNELNSGDE